jgi:hypothetical protein
MTSISPNLLTIDEFLKYKYVNRDMLPEIQEYYNSNKHRFNRVNNINWRKYNGREDDQKLNDNWLISNKFKQSDDEKLYSQFRGILNKLSDGNFNNLAKEITNLEIEKHEHLLKLVDFIFNKAITENKFSLMYAKLSKELSGYYVNTDDKMIYFRELLINKCQQTFNECVFSDTLLENKTPISKELSTGCMIFIGDLYNCELLTNKIINSCFLLLLKRSEQNRAHMIDNICALMRVVGRSFNQKCVTESNTIFEKLDKLMSSGVLINKDKFALMDLFDLKKGNNW